MRDRSGKWRAHHTNENQRAAMSDGERAEWCLVPSWTGAQSDASARRVGMASHRDRQLSHQPDTELSLTEVRSDASPHTGIASHEGEGETFYTLTKLYQSLAHSRKLALYDGSHAYSSTYMSGTTNNTNAIKLLYSVQEGEQDIGNGYGNNGKRSE